MSNDQVAVLAEGLADACARGDADGVRRLIEGGVDLEQLADSPRRGATALFAAAHAGATECTHILCEAGAHVNARAADGSTALLVACEAGHLGVAQCLASYMAVRDPLIIGCLPWSSTAEEAAKRRRDAQLLLWLEESATWTSQLQFVEALTEERATRLLRSGHESPIRGNPSPAKRAEQQRGFGAAAQLILRAASPWSPLNHSLWGAPQRARAVALCRVGHLIAYHRLGQRADGQAFIDCWIAHVMPRAITWQEHGHEGMRLTEGSSRAT